jgi:hypothetical protein
MPLGCWLLVANGYDVYLSETFSERGSNEKSLRSGCFDVNDLINIRLC